MTAKTEVNLAKIEKYYLVENIYSKSQPNGFTRLVDKRAGADD